MENLLQGDVFIAHYNSHQLVPVYHLDLQNLRVDMQISGQPFAEASPVNGRKAEVNS